MRRFMTMYMYYISVYFMSFLNHSSFQVRSYVAALYSQLCHLNHKYIT
jgi:hypothetical protein